MSLTKDEKINILVAQDIMSIKNDINCDDYSFLHCILTGDGWKQYNNLTNEQINSEFVDRFEDIKDCAETLALAHKLNEEPIDLLKS
jgi:hypothetical protein